MMPIQNSDFVMAHNMVAAAERETWGANIAAAEIMRIVAEYYGVTAVGMASPRRDNAYRWPRHVAAYAAAALTPLSFPIIGRVFGNRDHSTICHSVSRVKARMKCDPNFKQEVDAIIARLSEGRSSARLGANCSDIVVHQRHPSHRSTKGGNQHG